jgi:DNA/RNA-binding domain of Phe-tRNA-synthetase-like protein
MRFTLTPSLVPIVRPGVLWLEGASVVARDSRLDASLAAAEAAVRVDPPAEVTAVRTMYKRSGLDPTKTRPSSEALLRRVRKGDTLPRINSMVDVCNWCSLEFQLPYGLYDAERIEGDVVLRFGRPGEAYAGIRKDEVHVGDRITLADARGPFGNPTSDSARTMVTVATVRALLVVFAPAGYDLSRLRHVLDTTSARMHQFTGSREAGRFIEGSLPLSRPPNG